MKQDLTGKIAVITGAGGGIGRATAECLAQNKMKIVLLGGNNIAKLEETFKAVKKFSDCVMIPGNLSDMNFIADCEQKVTAAFNGVDVLINNAGFAINSPFSEINEELYDKIMNINVKAPFFLTQKLLPLLKKSGSASVINLSSTVGHAGYPFQSAYVASKHAILGLTKSLANEYYKDNIRFHAICPGGVYTDMVKVARPDLSSEGMIDPKEIADIILFFIENRGNAVVDEIKVHRVNKEPFLI